MNRARAQHRSSFILHPSSFRVAAATALVCCGPGNTSDLPSADAPFRLLSATPGSVVPGSRLVVRGEGFRSGEAKITLQGTIVRDDGSTAFVDWSAPPSVQSATELWAFVGEDLLMATGGAGTVQGKLGLEQVLDGKRFVATLALTLDVDRELVPVLNAFDPAVIFFGDRVAVRGRGFLLGGDEGDMQLVATGTFVPEHGSPRQLAEYPLALDVRSREGAVYVHTSELFGLKVGTFEGRLVARNVHRSGGSRDSAPLEGRVVVLRSDIAGVDPLAASRGQKIAVTGHGFLVDAEDGTATSLRLRGRFVPEEGADQDIAMDLDLQVDDDPGSAVWVLRPQVVGEELVGPGAQPGVFTGTVAPVLANGREELVGEAWTGTLQVLPARQIVHLKFLPGFLEGLNLFGLRNLEYRVRARIMEVVQRDYEGFSVELRQEPPDDFAEWSTVEVTGFDPNGSDLFGLDNTCPNYAGTGTCSKDTGNLILSDYVGGTSADQSAVGSFPYGGVFIASFLRFSPNVCATMTGEGLREFKKCRQSTFPMRTDRFNSVFASFVPILDGTEATADEWAAGPRSAAVTEAVRVLGTIAGNTITHELGHSLGLAQETGAVDDYHNAGDTPGWIMNPGGARPFEERAELDGRPPPTWAPGDAEYLLRVLPGR